MSPKNIIIHIGMPKSASTFLQKMVFPNLTDVHYCTYRNPLFSITRDLEFMHKDLVNIAEYRKKADDYIEQIKENNILISNEMIFGNPWHNFMNHYDMAELLKLIFPTAKILVIIRKQDDFLASCYLQAVKIGFPQSKKNFFNLKQGVFGEYNYNGGMNIGVKTVNLYHFINYYANIFGKENIFIQPYELLRKNENQFLENIFNFFKLTPYYPSKSLVVNRGYSTLTLPTALFLKKFIAHIQSSGYGFFRERPFREFLLKHYEKSKLIGALLLIVNPLTLDNLFKLFDKIYYKKVTVLTADEKKVIMKYHSTSNQKLSTEFNLNLDEWNYY